MAVSLKQAKYLKAMLGVAGAGAAYGVGKAIQKHRNRPLPPAPETFHSRMRIGNHFIIDAPKTPYASNEADMTPGLQRYIRRNPNKKVYVRYSKRKDKIRRSPSELQKAGINAGIVAGIIGASHLIVNSAHGY